MSASARRRRVIIVGASLAGFTVADTLRRQGHEGDISLIGDETHLPYDRPPLSKQVLARKWAIDRAELTNGEELAAARITLRTGLRALAASTAERTVTLSNGETVSFDVLVVATGLRARTFGLAEPAANVHVLRTIDDAQRLSDALQPGRSLTVVGAGFLGLEIASTASQLGVKVTVVEPQPRPLGAILDPAMADRITGLFTDCGVSLRFGCGVSSIARGPTPGDSVVTTLTDGARLTSDHVVLALGAAPSIDWLSKSGVPTGDGVLCDAHLQAGEHVFAAGDVANWPDSITGQRTRIEHRTNAVEQAAVVAHNIVCRPGEAVSHTPVPFVWSDQLGHRVQIFGRPRSSDEVISADTDPAKPVSIHCRDGRIAGVIGLDNGKQVRCCSQLIGQPDSHARTDGAAPQQLGAR